MGIRKKLLITGVVIALIAVLFLVDFAISRTYSFQLESVTPEVVYADNKQPVTIEIRLTRFGESVEGHSLYAVAVGGGSLKANRVLTDENGMVTLIYYPYTSNRFMPAQPVNIEIIDESNSFIFEVNAEFSGTLDLKDKQ